MDECRKELRMESVDTKATAVQKLNYVRLGPARSCSALLPLVLLVCAHCGVGSWSQAVAGSNVALDQYTCSAVCSGGFLPVHITVQTAPQRRVYTPFQKLIRCVLVCAMVHH